VALPDLSKLTGTPISAIELPSGAMVVCVVRDGQPVAPAPDETIRAGDELIVYSRQLDVEDVRRSLSS
jgi:Trk K+ transport system NAD-binding subunit